MNECRYCKGQLVEQRISRMQEYKGQWYLIEHVPALVCQQCGEVYYSPETHDLILHLVHDPDTQPVRIEQLNVLDANRAS